MRGYSNTETDFWSRQVAGDGGCVIWVGSIDRYGYGEIRFDGKRWRAHRLAYSLAVEPIPVGLDLDHLCRVRACVNPNHLDPVDREENRRRGTLAGGYSKIEKLAKEICSAGHEMTEQNTTIYVRKNGGGINRRCRTCKNEKRRKA